MRAIEPSRNRNDIANKSRSPPSSVYIHLTVDPLLHVTLDDRSNDKKKNREGVYKNRKGPISARASFVVFPLCPRY